MVITPDVPDLRFALHNGIRYFELVAESVKREMLSGLFVNAWGYNGSMPGPTIYVQQYAKADGWNVYNP